MSHFLLMTTYAFLISAFFALLWRSEPRSRLVLFAKMFGALVLGGLVLSWLMYFFPMAPPGGFS